ncbi:MAG TPA: cytochrome c maturation protein CcmE [Solirubrobacterales bacterium]|nr:cytochrome c maturation protein CcmE [Solirubrobacterales bacterium]
MRSQLLPHSDQKCERRSGGWSCDNPANVDPARKRTIRLVVALSVAVLLAVALIYTSFSASTEAKEPSQLLSAAPGTSYEMTGRVVPGSIEKQGNGIAFRVEDREGESESLPVTYTGTVPDPFRGGREIVLTGAMKSGTFVGEPETLITKCPSKFTTKSDG